VAPGSSAAASSTHPYAARYRTATSDGGLCLDRRSEGRRGRFYLQQRFCSLMTDELSDVCMLMGELAELLV
jgi:hypothetical protein